MYLTGSVYGEENDVFTGSGKREEKDGQNRFSLLRREECIGQVEVREKKMLYRTGSGEREEKDDQDRFMLERREKCAGHHELILI